MKKHTIKISLLASAALLLTVTSCRKDKNNPNAQKTITITNVTAAKDFVESGAFYGVGNAQVQLPVVLPGQSINFKFSAGKTQSLMFATMYGASKDWFFATAQPGIKLFDNNGNAITGDVSAQIKLWDNGTKDTSGAAESKPIAVVPNVNPAQLMNVTLAYNDVSSEFTLTITNTSGGTANETPFSPGVWAVSNVLGGALVNSAPFFTPGAMSNPEITDIAQMGNVNKLLSKTTANTGIITGFSPTVVVVYSGSVNPLFELGKADKGQGLKDLAQFGNPNTLVNSLKNAANIKSVYVAGNGPVPPGQSVSTAIDIASGDKIAYATMFGYSNDWFFANQQEITSAATGDITSQTALFESGTGVDQYPGAGNHQALFGGTPQSESLPVNQIGTSYPVPATNQLIKVTLN